MCVWTDMDVQPLISRFLGEGGSHEIQEKKARRQLALRAHRTALSIVAVHTNGQTLRAARSPELGL